MSWLHDRIASPIGDLDLLIDEEGRLRGLAFPGESEAAAPEGARRGEAPAAIRDALAAYFAGRLEALDEIPVKTSGSAFEEAAWAALRRIPVGETRSYGEQAAAIGKRGAARAVGGANHRNPVAIVIPCHRVIGADGELTGYGGGMERKRWLLHHEGALADAAP